MAKAELRQCESRLEAVGRPAKQVRSPEECLLCQSNQPSDASCLPSFRFSDGNGQGVPRRFGLDRLTDRP